ncbi:MAG: 16S rRNA (cytosine(1402)-N(4))-methyltransferase RsmH [Actinobacteria bacterium]|nr:16S rRNA (cytosine(1402)-N(4))-methyltransferase RsmH [Actinomycetota bacterium]
MVDRIVELLSPAISQESSILIDATLGAGGHAAVFLEKLPHLKLIGIDRDATASRLATVNLQSKFGLDVMQRFQVLNIPYDQMQTELNKLKIIQVDAVLFDLGVSSMQLDQLERGFSYSKSAPLDMRMDTSSGTTAAELLNSADVRELIRILKVYGEERFATRIANEIVRARTKQKFETTDQLVALIYEMIPAPARRTGGHPAKRTFQALRIAVNNELQILERAIPAAIELLKIGGRLAVLSYHSLEDRIVKQALNEAIGTQPAINLPIALAPAKLKLLTRGIERPSASEIAQNPRAASAKLRAAEILIKDAA